MQVITKGEAGGAQTHVLALCQALSQQVRFTAVIGGNSQGSHLASALGTLDIPVFPMPELGNSLSPSKTLSAVRALLGLMREHKPDILHAHSSVAGAVARIAGRIHGTPVIYTVHGFAFKPEAPRSQRWAAWLAERALAGLGSHMICVSNHEMNLARGLGVAPRRLSVILNAVPDVSSRAQSRSEPMHIVMVARFARPKRPDLLLRALALLRDRLGHETAATLIGDGPDLEAARALALRLDLRCLDFPGAVDDVARRLAQHNVFVLMSDHEGLPISIIEAMRAGLAIAASDLPGVRELLGQDADALFVPNDPASLADALQMLAASPEMRARLGLAGRLRYEDRLNLPKMAAALENLYGQIARHEPPRDHQR